MDELSASDCVLVVLGGPAAGDGRERARRLLLDTAARCLGTPVARLELVTPVEGRPLVRRDGGATGLHAGLSHGRGVVAVAVSWLGPVGVDVEAFRPLPAVALARRWFPAAEAELVRAAAPSPAAIHSGLSNGDGGDAECVRRFLLLWTQKEAVGKAIGRGLRGSGTRRAMPEVTAAEQLTEVPGAPGVGVAAWWRDATAVAVACAAPGGRIEVERDDSEEGAAVG